MANSTGVPIDKDGFVTLRGLQFPVEILFSAMAEVGGIVVADPKLNQILDKVVSEKAEAILLDSYPDYYFVPKRIRVHTPLNPLGELTDRYLYFAVPAKNFHVVRG